MNKRRSVNRRRRSFWIHIFAPKRYRLDAILVCKQIQGSRLRPVNYDRPDRSQGTGIHEGLPDTQTSVTNNILQSLDSWNLESCSSEEIQNYLEGFVLSLFFADFLSSDEHDSRFQKSETASDTRRCSKRKANWN
ncbi:hypothetical protein J6590_030490 [Homalodisca vitripennis]|nr:hypothetical protein J6590_030490 [Homalodisca vitripennis]